MLEPRQIFVGRLFGHHPIRFNGPTQTRDERDDSHAESIRLLFTQASTGLVTTLIVAATLVWALWSSVSPVHLLVWFTSITGLSLLRGFILVSYRQAEPDPADQRRWSFLFITGVAAAGTVWGITGVWFTPASPFPQQLFVIWILGGIAVGAIPALAFWMPAYLSFLVPALLPVCLWCFLQPDPLYTGMGVLILAFATAMLFTARHVNTLSQAKDQAERTTLELERQIHQTRHAQAKLSESEQRFRSVSETIDAIIFVFRETFLYMNPAGLKKTGYTEEEALAMPVWQVIHPDQRETVRQRVEARLAGYAEQTSYDAKVLTKSGDYHWMHISTGPIRFGGKPAGIGTAIDITDRKQAEEALFREKERAQVTLESIGDCVITTDTAGKINYLNPGAEKLIARSLRDAEGRVLLDVVDLVDETAGGQFPDLVAHCLQEGRTIHLLGPNALVRRPDGQEFSVEVTAAPMRERAGHVIGVVLVLRDITKLRGLTSLMSYQATHDALTGLLNRREFELRLQNTLETVHPQGGQHALLYLDLDQFKVVNDTCGHGAGDELMRQLTANLQGRVRDSDILARLGGDEFGILLRVCPLDKAQEIAEYLVQMVRDFRFEWKDKIFEVGMSIGLVSIDADSGTVADVLSAADSACYVAKEHGRNRVHIFQQDDSAVALRHGQMRWMQRILRALDENRFRLYRQTILPLGKADKEGWHGELLLRMVEEDGQLIPPGLFLAAAERYHLMPMLDRWVIRAAFSSLSNPHAGVEELKTCAINLSGQSLGDEQFLDFVIDLFKEYGVSPQIICFEITETAVIADLERALQFISVLSAMGCRFALDDFGSGLSSFAYLKRLPVDYLKIDGSFVKDMMSDPIDYAMVESIQRVGHVMGIRTIAEFVEDEETQQALQRLGVDYAQGYAIDRPSPLEHIGQASVSSREM